MINEAISLIRTELVTYLKVTEGYNTADDIVIIDNIGLFESSGSGINFDDKIVLTLANIEEESTLKNISAVRRGSGNTGVYENPPAYLNLYLLISSCNSTTKANVNENYLESLKKLSHVIKFFQGKNSFSLASSSGADLTKFSDDELNKLFIKVELYTLTFEQINHLWGTLGGKQMPSVMYKLRLVAITGRKQVREVPLIEEIETHLTKVSDDC